MPTHPEPPSNQEPIPAGDFSTWLRRIRASMRGHGGMDVACGSCIGCCSAFYFIHIRPEEADTRRRIPPELLFPAPGHPEGHLLMGYDQAGHCPMLQNRQCTIYAHRPQTCRNYDCRVFAAADIAAGGQDKTAINERVARWAFSYPTLRDRAEHAAVKIAARFIREQGAHFPGGRGPDNPNQIALLALKAYTVFLTPAQQARATEAAFYPELAQAVVAACRAFDDEDVDPANGAGQ